MNYKGKKRGGHYWLDNKPLVSVTQVLSIIDKKELMYWFGKQVYLAMVKDPTLSQEDALKAPWSVSDKAMNRGSTVHSIVESYKISNRQLNIDGEFGSYAKNFYQWLDDLKPEILSQEKTVFNMDYKYAGTLDLLVRIGNNRYVVDVKTGKQIYNEAFLQTAAYKLAINKKEADIDGIAVLLLPHTGTYQWQVINNSTPESTHKLKTIEEGFIHALELYKAKHYEDLKAVGYFAY